MIETTVKKVTVKKLIFGNFTKSFREVAGFSGYINN